MEDCFKLLHFHLGSQIPNIRIVKGALNEAARVYVELVKRRRRPASTSTSAAASASTTTARRPTSSRASTTRCRNTPTTSSTTSRRCATRPACRTRRSSRRAAAPSSPTTACWSSTCSACPASATSDVPTDGDATTSSSRSSTCIETYRDLTARNALESYHDAQQALDMALNLFNGGYLPLEQRSHGREPVLGDLRASCRSWCRRWTTCPRSCRTSTRSLSDTYFCNFSLFQSMPDSWAIKQLFPIMPIHRLERAADAARRARRHHLRLGRQDRPVHRPPRRQAARCRCTRSTASRTTSACSWSAPTRRSSATCTTCSATRTPCTSASTTTATSCSTRSSRATRCARCSTTSSSTPTRWSASCATDVEAAVRDGRIDYEESGRLLRFYEDGLHGYTYLEEPNDR